MALPENEKEDEDGGPDLMAEIEPDLEVYRQLNYLFIYGLVGKRD